MEFNEDMILLSSDIENFYTNIPTLGTMNIIANGLKINSEIDENCQKIKQERNNTCTQSCNRTELFSV